MMLKWCLLFFYLIVIVTAQNGYPRDVPFNQLGYNYERQNYAGDNDEEFHGDEIPGEPGRDYPVYAEVPETSFSCQNQQYPGYYADPEAQCQVFYICQRSGKSDAFLCPNGTIFNQEFLVCDWWYNVDCDRAQQLYSVNELVVRAMEEADARLIQQGYNYNSPLKSGNSNGYSNGNGHSNGNGYTNGNGHSNGNGYTNGNGHLNGNGYTNGNGHSNGNGYTNGNGYSNGNGNGYSNGNGNGYTNGNGNGNGFSAPQKTYLPPANGNGHNGLRKNGYTNGNGFNTNGIENGFYSSPQRSYLPPINGNGKNGFKGRNGNNKYRTNGNNGYQDLSVFKNGLGNGPTFSSSLRNGNGNGVPSPQYGAPNQDSIDFRMSNVYNSAPSTQYGAPFGISTPDRSYLPPSK